MSDEASRLEALRRYHVLYTPPEQAFGDLAALAVQICRTPIALISFIDEHRQWFKAKVGLSTSETPREHSFCAHAIEGDDLFIVPDATLDERFSGNPLVTGEPHIRFYAGAPLVTDDGFRLGTLCIIDSVPRVLEERQLEALRSLGRQVMSQLERRRLAGDRRSGNERMELAANRLAAIVESSDDAIIGKDLDGIVTDWNKGAERIFGYTAEEMEGQSILRLIPADRQAEELHILQEIARGNLVRSFETLRQTKDGRLIEVSVTSSPIKDATGKIVGASKVVRDIAERNRAGVALIASEKRYRTLFDHTPDGIAVADPQGNYLDVNASFCRLLGYTRDELLRLNISDVVHPSELQAIEPVMQALSPAFKHHRIWIFRRKDGSTFPGEVIGTLMPEGDALGLVRDVTESRKVERRLRRLIDSNVQGVIFWNNTGRITSANDAFLRTVGYDREDLERGSINWLGMTPPEHEEADRRALLELAARGVASAYEKEYFRKDGSRVPVLVGVATFEDTVNEGVCFVVDLTERKKLELQFLRAQRMESVGTLASGVAHDLNNVLAPILMSLELLKEGTRSEDDLELLATLHTSARRGADLVKQLLAFARGVAGERVQVDPRAVMNDLLAVMRETFPKSIDVRFSPPSTLWPIIGDATQLYQVLLNLCVNARDAMPKGGSLTVKMANVVLDATYAAMNRDARPGAYVRMQVADTGTGIAPEVREKIFEPFFTTKGVGKGTGLGLSTTLGIIKSHGGFVHVYSEPGRGTQFEVYLPAAASVAAEPAPKAVTASLLPRGNGELILVVDDEAAIRRIVQQLLEKYGYRVLVATQGAEGLAIYTQRQQEIAAVLTDMAMPIMDGAALIIALREMNPGVRIIASSGLSTNQEISKATGTGARAFLPKPYTAEAILGTLHALLHD